jgi:hypothetical protein
MRQLVGLLALLGAGAVSSACATPPPVTADGLPLRRVVVYRNGVGYFERAGHVTSDRVTFKVRASEVGDFLATLAVMERGGSSVRSASFPMSVDKEPEEPDDPGLEQEALLKPVPKKKKPDPNRLEKVVLALDGKEHDLEVGYVAVTPVWRPSYRLVVHKDGADLQAWGIVQNLSGEDWANVAMTLVAGAPLAFESSLGTPVTPERPKVSDTGEVIAVVPQSEVSLGQGQPAPVATPSSEVVAAADAAPVGGLASGVLGALGGEDAEEDGDDDGRAEGARKPRERRKGGARAIDGRGHGAGGVAGKTSSSAAPAARPPAQPRRPRHAAAPPPPPPPPRAPGPSAPRNLSALAAIAVESGVTRFDIPNPVSVPNKSATMVMLLSKRVPGELAFLFAPDPGVPASGAHPFRVVRFSNATGGTLERGPVAIFESGAFLGQGLVDQLPSGAGTTVPFALERSLAVDVERKYGEEGARVAKIEAGELTIERDTVSRTTYKIRNGGDHPAKVLVKHPRAAGARLFQPPKGTEDNVGTGSALVPAEVAPRATSELLVDERHARARRIDWIDPLADEAVKAYVADARADGAVRAALGSAWEIRDKLVKAHHERTKLDDEQQELSRATEETRRNLKVLEKNAAAADLRGKLTRRLDEISGRLAQITKRLVEVDIVLNEQRVRFSEAVRSIKISTPLPARDR